MKYNELSQNFNPTFRIGFYRLSEQEKKEIEDILGNEFYSYYEASLIEGNELLNQPDIILTKKNDETLEKIKQYCGASSLIVTKAQIESPSTVCFNNEKSIEESKRRILDSAIIGNTQKISQIINQSEDGLTVIPELLKKKDKHTNNQAMQILYKLLDEADPKLDRSIVNALERTLEDNKVYSNKTR